jgi:hypothetical protein
MANLAVVSRTPDSIDVLYVARRDGDARWALYDTWWSAADGWGIPPHTWAVGGTAIDVEPLARVAGNEPDAGLHRRLRRGCRRAAVQHVLGRFDERVA